MTIAAIVVIVIILALSRTYRAAYCGAYATFVGWGFDRFPDEDKLRDEIAGFIVLVLATFVAVPLSFWVLVRATFVVLRERKLAR